MPTFYVSEFSEMPFTDVAVGHSWPMQPGIDQSPIAISATLSTASSAFNVNTRFVRIATDTTCFFAFSASGQTPTATTNNALLPANTIEFHGVQGGGKVAVIS
jgi:hypothetical protein